MPARIARACGSALCTARYEARISGTKLLANGCCDQKSRKFGSFQICQSRIGSAATSG